MADIVDEYAIQKAEQSQKRREPKRVSAKEPKEKSCQSRALYTSWLYWRSSVLTFTTATSIESPVEPAQTLSQELSDSEDVGESSSGAYVISENK